MEVPDSSPKGKLQSKHLVLLSLMVCSTGLFLTYRYSNDVHSSYRPHPPPKKHDHPGFLVFSNSCHIPDLDPFHYTVAKFVESEALLDCTKDYPPLTYSTGNVVKIDQKVLSIIATRWQNQKLTCCYRELYRPQMADDNKVIFSKECKTFELEATVNLEFLKVECSVQGKIVYTNFHSFIIEKEAVSKRCEEKLSHVSDKRYSLLILGIDAVSRLNIHRQLKDTVTYLKADMNVTEMYGYNKVGDNTFPNLIPVLTGYSEHELSQVCWNKNTPYIDKCPFLWKKFENQGYRTLYAEDAPHISTFNYLKRGFYTQPTDYYLRPFILAAEDQLGREKPLNCYLCVGPKSETEIVLNWMQAFVEQFHNQTYLAFGWINSLSHDFLNYPAKGDHFYYQFFKHLYSKGLLNSTIVILLSDHGMRWGGIRSTYIGKLEERLPTLMFFFPKSFQQQYPSIMEAIYYNTHRLTTPYDLHATLENILNFTGSSRPVDVQSVPSQLISNYSQRAVSLFKKVPKERACEEAAIDEHWCTCIQSQKISPNSTEVFPVAMFLLESLNNIVKTSSDVCASLSLVVVRSARYVAPKDHLQGDKASHIHDYILTIQTRPGGGIFEGSVRVVPSKQHYEILGAISRLNLYGNQSHCVNDANLRKYCYCKEQLH
ncbi:uncharacterized protein LOC143255917 isoform X1 [Tachypleus tridentatus]|uniref:uncharacterized protein LOC143255917 isoform X1 n=2 Tax=Tachypleus tridentatus TaxID=6853 RepID=UPI003FD55AD7